MKERWTKPEIIFLEENYTSLGPDRCWQALGRSLYSTKQKAVRLCLSAERREFTKSEIEYIKANYAEKGPIELSREMGLKRDSIYGVAQKLGIKMTPKSRGRISARVNTGRKMSDSCKAAISKANKKHHELNHCESCGVVIGYGAKHCQPCELKSRSGKGHNWWNGGVTPLYGAVFKRLYPVWKLPIMQRDDFTCQDCGVTGVNLEVHHSKRLFTEIRDKVIKANPYLSIEDDKLELAELIVREHNLEDGITLCRSCHEKKHWSKQGELMGPPNASGEGNHQPSRSNVVQFVDRKVQRLTGEETQTNNPDTSALHAEAKGVMI